MKHLLREYVDKKPQGECGRKGLKESEATVKACEVTCPQCHKTKAFARAAKHPHFGLKGKPPKKARKRKPKNEIKETEKKVRRAAKKAKRTGKPVVVAEQKPKKRRREVFVSEIDESEMDMWDDVLLKG
jgi:hypothetical protein